MTMLVSARSPRILARISGAEGRLHRVTPTGEQIIEEHGAEEARTKQRRAPFKFSMVGLNQATRSCSRETRPRGQWSSTSDMWNMKE